MKKICDNTNEKIIYSINIEDLQYVANDILKRNLSKKEIVAVENKVGDFIPWYNVIEFAISNVIKRK